METISAKYKMIKTLVIECPSCDKVYHVYEQVSIDAYLADQSPLICNGCEQSILVFDHGETSH